MYQAPNSPQSIGGVLDDGFGLFRAAFKDTFVLAGVAALLSPLLNRLFLTAGAETPSGAAILGIVIASLVILAMTIAIYAVVIVRIDAVARGRALTLGAATEIGIRRAPAVLGAGILYGLAVLIGCILLLIPGIFLMVALAFAVYAVVTEQLGPIASQRFSWRLVRGYWWRTAVIMTIVGIIVSILYFLLGLIGGIIVAVDSSAGGPAPTFPWYIDFVLGPIIAAVVYPLAYSLFMAAFNDLKLRHEGGDLAARIETAGA